MISCANKILSRSNNILSRRNKLKNKTRMSLPGFRNVSHRECVFFRILRSFDHKGLLFIPFIKHTSFLEFETNFRKQVHCDNEKKMTRAPVTRGDNPISLLVFESCLKLYSSIKLSIAAYQLLSMP